MGLAGERPTGLLSGAEERREVRQGGMRARGGEFLLITSMSEGTCFRRGSCWGQACLSTSGRKGHDDLQASGPDGRRSRTLKKCVGT
eukprot:748383-Hanusia_phi.AAC.3